MRSLKNVIEDEIDFLKGIDNDRGIENPRPIGTMSELFLEMDNYQVMDGRVLVSKERVEEIMAQVESTFKILDEELNRLILSAMNQRML